MRKEYTNVGVHVGRGTRDQDLVTNDGRRSGGAGNVVERNHQGPKLMGLAALRGGGRLEPNALACKPARMVV
jgi:hypothetical protein